ncbi:hypothetical protein EJB05_02631, partial [Eragrostis curvula]
MASPPPPRVCVTGAGGFIASWLVKLLLSRGYAVHATVRDPGDPKNAFLTQLDGASPENLRLFKADVLDIASLAAAFAGCEGVFHPASPVPEEEFVDPEFYGTFASQRDVITQREMMAPTVDGMRNVLQACSAANVKKLVVVSSAAAVCFNPAWPDDKIKDETCWSDKELCEQLEVGNNGLQWYCLAKTQAEEMALEYGPRNGLHVVTILPGAVVGPLLQTVRISLTMRVLRYIIKGGPDTMNNKFWPVVHVADVADALLLVYEKAESSGRYICALEQMDIKDMVNLLKSKYPDNDYVDKTVDVDYKIAMSSDKLRSLGWKSKTVEETLVDGLEYLEKAGLLKQEPSRLPYFYRVTADE